MTTATMLNRWQSFVWLWRNDPEAKWFWLSQFLTGSHLRNAVIDNLCDFGFYPKQLEKQNV